MTVNIPSDVIFSGQISSTEPRTCKTCVHSKDNEHGFGACLRNPHPVTGEGVILCQTERLFGLPNRSEAVTLAKQVDLCGPDGTYWEFFQPPPPPAPIGFWKNLGRFWKFWA